MVLWAPARPWVPTWHILQLLLIGLFHASKLIIYAVLPLGRTVFYFPPARGQSMKLRQLVAGRLQQEGQIR